MGETIASDVALVDYLNSTIRGELTFHRHHYGLPAPDMKSPRPHALIHSVKTSSSRMSNWKPGACCTFATCVSDLALGWEEMAGLVGQTTRNLRRRQMHGVQRLLHCLILQELQVHNAKS